MVDQNGREHKQVESVNKTFQVIELLRELEGAGVTELATHLNWPKSTVHSHLETLERNEYIIREEGEYKLGLRFLEIGEYVKNREPIFSLIEPKLKKLAEDVGERFQFVVNEHGDGVYVRIATGERAVSTGSRLGRRRSMLHATAAGKSILAFLPKAEVQNIVAVKGLPQLTPNTITDEDELFDALAEVHERGYAFNHEEHIEGLRAVAVPVQDTSDRVVGAISVAGPAHRMQGEWFHNELPDKILGARNEVELDLEYR